MSHFSVIVIGDDVDEQLAPYQENNMGDCPKEYLEFHDMEPECREEYANGVTERVLMPDGRLLMKWDDEFRKEGSFGVGTDTHEVPDHLTVVELPFSQLYPTFEQFMDDYHGYRFDEEQGKFGYWENPNKKWDGYTIGGRWTGYFPVKNGAVPVLGATVNVWSQS